MAYNEESGIKTIVKWVGVGVGAVLLFITFLGSFKVMNGEEVGVRVTWGSVAEDVDYGFSFKWPWGISEYKIFPTTTQKLEESTEVYTKDIQTSRVTYTFTYRLNADSANLLYKTAGMGYVSKLVKPIVDGVIKNTIGKWTASDLVGNREKAREQINKGLAEEINSTYFCDLSFQIIDIEYSDAFEKSINEKVTAEQDALKAKNRTVQVEEEGRQRVIQAKAAADAVIAEAEGKAQAMDIEGKALARNPQVIRLRELEVQNELSKSASHWQTVILSSEQSKSLLNVGK